MDAVEKAAEALTQHMLAHAPPGQRPDPVAVEAMTRVVLDAVSPHESSDEGTCWCPVAEQAGRERDAAREEIRRLAGEVARLGGELHKARRSGPPKSPPWGDA